MGNAKRKRSGHPARATRRADGQRLQRLANEASEALASSTLQGLKGDPIWARFLDNVSGAGEQSYGACAISVGGLRGIAYGIWSSSWQPPTWTAGFAGLLTDAIAIGYRLGAAGWTDQLENPDPLAAQLAREANEQSARAAEEGGYLRGPDISPAFVSYVIATEGKQPADLVALKPYTWIWERYQELTA